MPVPHVHLSGTTKRSFPNGFISTRDEAYKKYYLSQIQ